MMKNSEKSMDKIIALCKNRGFVFAGSEIYGGLANSWDYGPLGVEFKNNVKKAWLKKFVQESPYNVGLDAAIIMNPQTWITTGHVSSFSDPLLDCKACKARHRADKLIGEEHHEVNVDAMSFDEMDKFIAEHEDIVCPVCGKHDFTPIRKFNLMFKTAIGVTEDSSSTCYLRPETAQGIFVNFANIQRTTRRKLPFGVCQVGKAFRNEITPGNFTFRTREFEQIECEFFCKPGTDLEWFAYWKDYCVNWLKSLGIHDENLRLRDHEPAELAFYSRATTDIEYAFPFTDWGELWGIADRTDYDLKRHQEASGKDLTYFDQEANEHYIPYVIEPSLGCDRVALAFLCEAYDEEVIDEAKNDVRVCCTCIRRSRRTRQPSCRSPRSWRSRPARSIRICAATSCSTTTTPAPSASAIAVRTRSARRTASPSTSRPSATTRPRPTTPSPSVSATPWSRSASHQRAEELAGRAHQILIQLN